MTDRSHLRIWLERALRGAQPRGAFDLSPGYPYDAAPVLLQDRQSLFAAALGVELLSALARFGGTAVRPSTLDALRARMRPGFSDSEWAFVDTEAEQIVAWLEQSLGATYPEEPEGPEWDIHTRRTMIVDAMAADHDLYLEFLGTGPDARGRIVPMYHRLRLRPERVESQALDAAALGLHGAPDDDVLTLPDHGEVVHGSRVPDGASVALALEQIRWLMAVRRFGALQSPNLADVLAFPGSSKD